MAAGFADYRIGGDTSPFSFRIVYADILRAETDFLRRI